MAHNSSTETKGSHDAGLKDNRGPQSNPGLNYNLLDKLAQFNREKIPERAVHARGAGAYGEFEVTITWPHALFHGLTGFLTLFSNHLGHR